MSEWEVYREATHGSMRYTPEAKVWEVRIVGHTNAIPLSEAANFIYTVNRTNPFGLMFEVRQVLTQDA